MNFQSILQNIIDHLKFMIFFVRIFKEKIIAWKWRMHFSFKIYISIHFHIFSGRFFLKAYIAYLKILIVVKFQYFVKLLIMLER